MGRAIMAVAGPVVEPRLKLVRQRKGLRTYQLVNVQIGAITTSVHIGALEIYPSWHRGVVTLVWQRILRSPGMDPKLADFKATLLLLGIKFGRPSLKINLRVMDETVSDGVLNAVSRMLSRWNHFLDDGVEAELFGRFMQYLGEDP